MSFNKLLTITANTSRVGPPVGGIEPGPVIVLSGILCMPLDPVDPEVRASMGLGDFREILQTMTPGDIDIREGDVLIVGSGSYPIRAISDWDWTPTNSKYKHLFIEEVKDV